MFIGALNNISESVASPIDAVDARETNVLPNPVTDIEIDDALPTTRPI